MQPMYCLHRNLTGHNIDPEMIPKLWDEPQMAIRQTQTWLWDCVPPLQLQIFMLHGLQLALKPQDETDFLRNKPAILHFLDK